MQPSNIALLRFIRSKNGCGWADLCRELQWEPTEQHTGTANLQDSLEQLSRAGLINERISASGSTEFVLSDQCLNILKALGLSLNTLADYDSATSIIVKPHFGKPDSLDPFDIFVAMPFDSRLSFVYTHCIQKVARKIHKTVKRGDDFFTPGVIMQDVWNAISACHVVIADCTHRNANVFYEIGVAHAIGKPVILITQSTDDMPFDLRHLRHIQYGVTPPEVNALNKDLKRWLEEVF